MVTPWLTGIPDSLHFVDVVIVDDVIEGGVELIEEVDHLMGSAGTRELSEAYNVTATREKHDDSFISMNINETFVMDIKTICI